MAHLISIFCRLKCFSSGNKAVKDFLIRCVALMVSCTNFKRLQDILLMTLTITIQSYSGKMVSGKQCSAEAVREKLFKYMAEEEHLTMDLLSQEDSEEFKITIKKLSASGLDPQEPNCFLNQSPDLDHSITDWLTSLKQKSEDGKEIKHEVANAYYLKPFYEHLVRLAAEFVL